MASKRNYGIAVMSRGKNLFRFVRCFKQGSYQRFLGVTKLETELSEMKHIIVIAAQC